MAQNGRLRSLLQFNVNKEEMIQNKRADKNILVFIVSKCGCNKDKRDATGQMWKRKNTLEVSGYSQEDCYIDATYQNNLNFSSLISKMRNMGSSSNGPRTLENTYS